MSFDTVMHYFREISAIPHGSGNTDKISAYCADFAKAHGLVCMRDNAGNVVIKRSGCGAPVMLQGHIDMVCESESAAVYDFENEAIRLVECNGYIFADGTTLGADDGSAAAIMLALLSEDNDGFPPLEAVFTVDEEIGMLGAKALDMSVLSARTMINIDSEDEGVITAGCAGGAVVTVEFPLSFSEQRGFKYEIKVSGLLGGHSGTEIGNNRANANKLLGKILRAIGNKMPFGLVSASGGNKDNAIPRMASAVIVTDGDETARINEICALCGSVFEKQFCGIESSISVSCAPCGESTERTAMPDAFIKFLCSTPNGVMALDGDKQVITSLNLGIMRIGEDCRQLSFSLRSNLADGTEKLAEKICALAASGGASSQISGEYPCWEYREKSPLRESVKKHYKALTGKEATVEIIHAGLECGVFAAALEGLDAVSIGPDIDDIHTPEEKMSISSFKRTYELVKTILANIGEEVK